MYHKNVTDSQTRVIGPYELLQQIGSGSFSEVYAARDTRTGTQVAIKLFLAHIKGDGFVREVGVGMGLRHPNLLSILDLGYIGAHERYVAYELAFGGSLRGRMNGQPADKAFARHALWEIARGLSALHARRMVHRDLKPENILLDTPAYFARLRITDFGTSEAVRHAAAQGDSGSPAYMSPEQIRGSCDTRADLYALGVIAYELVTGRRPFNGTPAEVLRGHLQRRPDWGKVPEKIRPVLARALAKNPDERYTHAYELAHDFDNVLADPHESNLEIQLGGYEAAAPELLARDPISGWQARRHEAGVQLTGRDAPAGTLPLAPDGVVEICSASLVSIAARDNRHLWLGLGANGFCHQAPLYGLPPLVVLRRFKGDAVTIEGGAQPSIAAYRWDGQVVARSPLVTPLAALLVVRDTLGEHIVGVDMQLRQVFFVEQESLGLRPAHLHVPEGIRTIGLQAGRLWLATQHGQQHFLTPAHY